MLSIATVFDLDIIQLDVKTAFLHGEIEEETYIKQPELYRVRYTRQRKRCLSPKEMHLRVETIIKGLE